MIKMIIFDLDGVLVDLLEVHRDCFIEAMAEYGIVVTQEFHDTWLSSLPTKKKLEQFGLPKDEIEKISNLKQQKTLAHLEKLSDDFGLQMTLKHLYERGYILGVASNSLQATIEITLRKLGIIGVFDAIRGNDTVDSPKPDPDIYYATICDVDIDSDILVTEVLIVEDSEVGKKAIAESGCHGLIVKNRSEVTLDNILNRIKEIENSNDESI